MYHLSRHPAYRFIVLAILFVSIISFFGCIAQQSPATNQANQTPSSPAVCDPSHSNTNASIAGYISMGSIIYNDSCKDNASVRKYLCLQGNPASRVINCPEGSLCDSGACVKNQNATVPVPNANTTAAPAVPCTDSDNGADFHIAGIAVVNSSGKITNYSDTCQGNYDLSEYDCINGTAVSQIHHCDNGEKCQGGACVTLEKTCTDTNTNDTTLVGSATLYGGGIVIDTKTDICNNETNKVDYSCQNGSVVNTSVICPLGRYCSNGACVNYCQDLDGGKDYFTASYVVDRGVVLNDTCLNASSLTEYFCSNNAAASEEYNCSGTCYQGMCIRQSDLKCKEFSTGKIVKILYGSAVIEQQNDTCLDYQTLRDYECVSDKIDYTETNCNDDEFCYAGACKKITTAGCYESSNLGGSDILHSNSYIVLTNNDSIHQVKESTCNSDTELTIYSCDDDSYKVSYERCLRDETCQDGKCVFPYTCNETDGGISVVPGSASLYDKNGRVVSSESDACFDDHSVWETYCDQFNHIAYAQLPCPGNKTCNSAYGSCE